MVAKVPTASRRTLSLVISRVTSLRLTLKKNDFAGDGKECSERDASLLQQEGGGCADQGHTPQP